MTALSNKKSPFRLLGQVVICLQFYMSSSGLGFQDFWKNNCILTKVLFLERVIPEIARTVISSGCQYRNKRKELSGGKKIQLKTNFFPISGIVQCFWPAAVLLLHKCADIIVATWKKPQQRLAQMQIWCNTGSLIIQFWVQLHGLKAIQHTHNHSVSQKCGLAEQRKWSVQHQRLLLNQSTKSFSLKHPPVWSL